MSEDLLPRLFDALPWALAVVGLLLAALAVVLALLVRRAREGDAGGRSPGAALRRLISDYASRGAAADLRAALADVDDVPWFLVLTPAGTAAEPLTGGVAASARAELLTIERVPGAALLEPGPDLVLRADGRTSDTRAWDLVVRLIRRQRPRRPLDGVLLALSTAQLYQPAANRQALTDAALRAEALYGKLADLQRKTGMRLPVWLVVADGERLPGLEPFLRLVPAASTVQMFGWSNPASPSTPFSDAWADQAIDAVRDRLDELLVRVWGAAEHPAGPAADPSYQISASCEAMRSPLAVTMRQLFAPAAGLEPFPLRGFYVVAATGASPGTPGSPAAGPAIAAAAAAPLFAPDLVEVKVVPEAPIGRPTAAAARRRLRLRLALNAATLVLVLLAAVALPLASSRVSARADAMLPLLDEAEEALAAGPAEAAAGADGDGGVAGAVATAEEAHVVPLLRAADPVKGYRLASPVVPTSWPSPLDGRIRASVTRAYDEVMMPAIRARLVEELDDLAATPLVPSGGYAPQPVPYATTAEFGDWRRFLNRTAAASPLIAAYDCLALGCSRSTPRLLADLDLLTGTLFGATLRPPTPAATHFYGRVLRRVDGEPLGTPAGVAGGDLAARDRALADSFHRRLFERNALLGDLEALTDELELLGSVSELPGTDATAYRVLLHRIDEVSADLVDPDLAWSAGETLALGSPYTDALAAVAASPLLGPVEADRVRADGEQGYQRYRRRLAAYSTWYTGPILAQKGGRPVLELSPSVLQIQAAVQGLLGESFMRPENARSIAPAPPPGTVFTWDGDWLGEATAQEASYQEFLSQGLEIFPPALRDQAADLARQSTGLHVVDAVAQAQGIRPRPSGTSAAVLEPALAAQVESFQAVDETLSTLVVDLAGLGLPSDAGQLATAIRQQRQDLLEQTDELLDLAALYQPRGDTFAWWDGTPVLAWKAFGAADDKALAAYLGRQRQRVSDLAGKYAQPALAGASTVTLPRDAVTARWTRIVDDVAAYDQQKPGNPLQELEDFATGPMKEVVTVTCPDEVPASLVTADGDWFLARRSDLAAGIRRRCATLLVDDAVSGYRRLAALFNQRLAHRFPFADRVPGRGAAEAEPAAVAAFYQLFDEVEPAIAAAGGTALGPSAPAVSQFLADMAAARPLFAPFLDDPKTYPVPVLGFEVAFRVARRSECGADNVIGWTLDVGGQAYTLGGATSSGRWSYGTPVTAALRWALDSPIVPVSTPGSASGSVADRTATYRYPQKWALFALLADHRATGADLQEPVPPPANPLLFEVGTAPAPPHRTDPQTRHEAPTRQQPPTQPGCTAADGNTARAFLAVTLETPDGKTELPLPELPTVAPVPGEAAASAAAGRR
jgi:type VI secretion system protein ImpL